MHTYWEFIAIEPGKDLRVSAVLVVENDSKCYLMVL